MHRIGRLFLKGLAVVLPAALTAYLLYWFAWKAESALGGLLQNLLPEDWYLPGLGLVLAAGLILLVGLLSEAWLFRSIGRLARRGIGRVPVVKTIYRSIQDIITFLQKTSDEDQLNQVVLVEFSDKLRMVGFVTREDLEPLPDVLDVEEDPAVAVYLPMSYQIGGYTTFVPRSALTKIDMPVQEALRMVFLAGVSADDDRDKQDVPEIGQPVEEG
ncbi:MAG: DUF502 domain-containing protein [Planctomycetota bacterium]